jgi:DNA gyrase/topoisomerase IV subunit A
MSCKVEKCQIDCVAAIVLSSQEGDALQFVGICSPTDSVLITSSEGLALHFPTEKLRPQARTGGGIQVGRHCGPIFANKQQRRIVNEPSESSWE